MLPEANRAEVERAIRATASESDNDHGSLDREIAVLAEQGWLRACLPQPLGGEGWGSESHGTHAAFEALRSLGRANLSVARLYEGHMNAVKLVLLHGSEPSVEEIADLIHNTALLGVWGADDPGDPLRYDEAGGELELRGAKRFASGLGIVNQAVVTCATDDGPQLLLVPTGTPDRCDAATWAMSGMRATQSGRYDFTGVKVGRNRLLGKPGAYHREPYFEGGVWRYCAAHLGGAEALYLSLLRILKDSGRDDDSHQRRRIVACATALETARLWLLRAAWNVEATGAGPSKANLSLLAREVTEDTCRTVMGHVEQALGMAAHEEGSPIERGRRDLSLFLCQAVPDAKRDRVGRALVASCDLAERL